MNKSEKLVQLGSRIREIRSRRKMTQDNLAKQCFCEKANISRIESGQTNLTLRSLYKISTALEVHITELFID
jgi:transcriptional regulator with XRE-family HTH domain